MATGTVNNPSPGFSDINDWKTVPASKRTRDLITPDNSPQKTQSKKPFTLINVSNRYSLLTTADDNTIQTTPQEKIPPIIVHNAQKYQQIIDDLKNKCIGEFETKLTKNALKVMLSTITDYRVITKFYDSEKIPYHTYAIPGSNTILPVVIRGLPYSLTEEEIKKELIDSKYPVQSVRRIVNKDKKPTPLVIVNVENNEKGKEIFSLDKLFYSIIRVEPKNKTEDIVMCKNCQRYNHTQKYCHLPSRCVKCLGDHHYTKCQQKEKDSVKCVNCSKNHPANYKGCEYYQIIKNNRNSSPPFANPINSENRKQTSHVRPDTTFANATRTYQNNENHTETQNTASNQFSSIFEAILTVIKPFLPQIITMITTFLSKHVSP